MNFTVIWVAAAEQELAAVWLRAADRDAVTTAVDALERRLATNPLTEGESREGTRRVTFERPVAVDFRADAVNRTVVVGRVWHVR